MTLRFDRSNALKAAISEFNNLPSIKSQNVSLRFKIINRDSLQGISFTVGHNFMDRNHQAIFSEIQPTLHEVLKRYLGELEPDYGNSRLTVLSFEPDSGEPQGFNSLGQPVASKKPPQPISEFNLRIEKRPPAAGSRSKLAEGWPGKVLRQ
jgi:hypothetical protein